MTRPNFFIVGAPKCGTTAMHAFLARHPEIFMSAHKEPHFFGSDLDWTERSPMPEERYLRLFAESRGEIAVGESSVFYLLSEQAATEIHASAPQARVLAMFRHPVDMLHSFHSQRLYNGTEDIPDFADALRAEDERRQGRRLPPHLGLRQGLYYSDLVRFDEQLARFLKKFPPEYVLVLLHEDFQRNPLGSYQRVLNFLGVDPHFDPHFSPINANKVARSRPVQNLLNTPPRSVRRLARIAMPTEALRRRVGALLRRANSRVQRREELSPQLRRQLILRFEPHIRGLEAQLGTSLQHWIDDVPARVDATPKHA